MATTKTTTKKATAPKVKAPKAVKTVRPRGTRKETSMDVTIFNTKGNIAHVHLYLLPACLFCIFTILHALVL